MGYEKTATTVIVDSNVLLSVSVEITRLISLRWQQEQLVLISMLEVLCKVRAAMMALVAQLTRLSVTALVQVVPTQAVVTQPLGFHKLKFLSI